MTTQIVLASGVGIACGIASTKIPEITNINYTSYIPTFIGTIINLKILDKISSIIKERKNIKTSDKLYGKVK